MSENAFDDLKQLDREALIKRMGSVLPEICKKLNVSEETLAEKTGVDIGKIKACESGRRTLKWSEFMTILFVIWNNDTGRKLIESEGLFPEVLRKAMSVNRNTHTV